MATPVVKQVKNKNPTKPPADEDPFSSDGKSVLPAPVPVDGLHNFSSRPRATGSPRPEMYAKDQAAADELAKPFFPGGKAPYERTQIQPPPIGRDSKGNPTVTPSSIGNQYLGRIPGGAEAFVAEQKANFEKARIHPSDDKDMRTGYEMVKSPDGSFGVDPELDGTRAETLRRVERMPAPNMIDFGRRDSPVSIVETGTHDPRYYPGRNQIAGVDPNKQGQAPHEKPVESPEEAASRYMNGLPVNGPVNPTTMTQTLGHEANHSYLNVATPDKTYEAGPSDNPEFQDPKGAGSYQTSDDFEWAQGVTSGLNGMRDITGQKLNTPFEIHKLLDEVEKTPAILDSLGDENARIFRSYLKINKESPESGKRMRESMARDSKYLVENEPPPSLEDQTMGMVRNILRGPDQSMG